MRRGGGRGAGGYDSSSPFSDPPPPHTPFPVSRKLANNEYRKLTQFGKDVRNLIGKKINDANDKVSAANTRRAAAAALEQAEARGDDEMAVEGAEGSSSDGQISVSDANVASIAASAEASTIAGESKKVRVGEGGGNTWRDCARVGGSLISPRASFLP